MGNCPHCVSIPVLPGRGARGRAWCSGTGVDTAPRAPPPRPGGRAAPTLPEVPGRTLCTKRGSLKAPRAAGHLAAVI